MDEGRKIYVKILLEQRRKEIQKLIDDGSPKAAKLRQMLKDMGVENVGLTRKERLMYWAASTGKRTILYTCLLLFAIAVAIGITLIAAL